MTVDPLARRGFASAEAYSQGRSGYAPQAVSRAVAELDLGGSSRLLDLAAGTGLLTRMLAPFVGSLVAVEPSRAMREALARELPAVELLDGVAQQLPLADGSVDAVVVGEAFHWFHGAAALDEIARMLRPRGGLALLWNVPVAMRPRTEPELAELLERHRAANVAPERRYASGAWRRAFEEDERWRRCRRRAASASRCWRSRAVSRRRHARSRCAPTCSGRAGGTRRRGASPPARGAGPAGWWAGRAARRPR